jgi:hypothetical protein
MTRLLQRAFEKASNAFEGQQQDALGRILLEELTSERRWEDLFAGSHDLLADLADQALAEHRAGRTEKLDPEKLRSRTKLRGWGINSA